MRKRVYRDVRHYLEIPKEIARASLGIHLEARRFADHIVISRAGRSDFFLHVEET
jgi:hypothetical protein